MGLQEEGRPGVGRCRSLVVVVADPGCNLRLFPQEEACSRLAGRMLDSDHILMGVHSVPIGYKNNSKTNISLFTNKENQPSLKQFLCKIWG